MAEGESERVIRGLRKFALRRLCKTKDFLWSAEAELEFRRIIISLLKRVVILAVKPNVNFLLMSENANEIEHSSEGHVGDGNDRQICCTRSEA